jgi:membrane protease YdiL (CAAX protease family)
LKWKNESLESRNLVGFFSIAFGWSWLYWSLFIFQIIKLPPGIGTPNVNLKDMLVYIPIVVFSPYGPTFAAFLLTYINEGAEATRELWRKCWNWNIPVKWLVIIFLWYPMINLIYRLGSAFIYNVPQPRPEWLVNPLMILLPFIASIINGGFSEEVGWRGYAMPRLQSRFNAVQSSLILGFMEGLWHTPLVFWPGDPRFGMSILLLILWQMIATFHRTWIFNNTGGSIFAAIMLHATGNTASWLVQFNLPYIEWFPRTRFVSPILIIVNIVIILLVIMVFGAETMTRKNELTNQPPYTLYSKIDSLSSNTLLST